MTSVIIIFKGWKIWWWEYRSLSCSFCWRVAL